MARSIGLLALCSVALGATVTPRRDFTASSMSSTPSSLVSRVCALRGGATERTFAMLKPDVAKDSATVNGIKAMIDGAGLTIEREERCRLSRRQWSSHQARALWIGRSQAVAHLAWPDQLGDSTREGAQERAGAIWHGSAAQCGARQCKQRPNLQILIRGLGE